MLYNTLEKARRIMSSELNDNLHALVEQIVDSYDSDHRTQRIGRTFQPSRTRIVEILEEIRCLLFPGFFGHKTLTAENIHYHVGNLLVRVGGELEQQIYHCLCSSRNCPDECEPAPCHRDAACYTRRFLERIPSIREMLALDAQAAYEGDPAAKSIDEIIYSYPGYHAIVVYRIAHELLELGVPLMPRIMSEHAHSITGCDIHPGAHIGRRFFIDHATGVVIGETSIIGDNVKIYQGVTLGAKSFPKDERGRAIKGLKRHPTIEDNVTIYPNATILGGDTVIGRGVTVGGNAYLMQSVEAHSLVKQEEPRLQVLSKPSRGESEK